jgi:23S rRNA U2552 (ribose-2'-O)-methylase RlmE/FtsJ
MRRKTEWQTDKAPPFSALESTVSGMIWATIPGGHKWLSYFPVYDKEFSRFRNAKPRILEIGVYRGASLQLWKKFFGQGSYIVGVDIDPACAQFNAAERGIYIEIGDQSDENFLKGLIEKHGPFDIIIDDGSHVASHQIASFNGLFQTGLRNDGVYLVEDFECMYWGDTDDYRDASVTSIEFFKMLIDIQNSIFEDYTYNDFAVHAPNGRDTYQVVDLAKSIASIKFCRGIAVIEKSEQMTPMVLHI